MSTTLTAILFAGSRYCLLNIGDSRTYLLRDGSLEQLTRDDSYVQLLVDEGHITQEAAGSHPQRNLVLQALTGEEVMEPAMTVHEARAGDRFMLCSDGLSDVVDHAHAGRDPAGGRASGERRRGWSSWRSPTARATTSPRSSPTSSRRSRAASSSASASASRPRSFSRSSSGSYSW